MGALLSPANPDIPSPCAHTNPLLCRSYPLTLGAVVAVDAREPRSAREPAVAVHPLPAGVPGIAVEPRVPRDALKRTLGKTVSRNRGAAASYRQKKGN